MRFALFLVLAMTLSGCLAGTPASILASTNLAEWPGNPIAEMEAEHVELHNKILSKFKSKRRLHDWPTVILGAGSVLISGKGFADLVDDKESVDDLSLYGLAIIPATKVVHDYLISPRSAETVSACRLALNKSMDILPHWSYRKQDWQNSNRNRQMEIHKATTEDMVALRNLQKNCL